LFPLFVALAGTVRVGQVMTGTVRFAIISLTTGMISYIHIFFMLFCERRYGFLLLSLYYSRSDRYIETPWYNADVEHRILYSHIRGSSQELFYASVGYNSIAL
jgi:hypothetical protein